MPTPPNKIINKIQEAALKEVNEDISRAYDELFGPKVANNQLPEHLFVEKFLPFFSGKVQDTRDLNIRTHWIGVAGSTMSPVDIVNEKGQVIYTVPALMSSDFLGSAENVRGQSFTEIFNYAKDQANRIPQLGDNILADQGVNKISKMSAAPRNSDENQWRQIFKLYGIEEHSDKKFNSDGKKDNLEDDFELE